MVFGKILAKTKLKIGNSSSIFFFQKIIFLSIVAVLPLAENNKDRYSKLVTFGRFGKGLTTKAIPVLCRSLKCQIPLHK